MARTPRLSSPPTVGADESRLSSSSVPSTPRLSSPPGAVRLRHSSSTPVASSSRLSSSYHSASPSLASASCLNTPDLVADGLNDTLHSIKQGQVELNNALLAMTKVSRMEIFLSVLFVTYHFISSHSDSLSLSIAGNRG